MVLTDKFYKLESHVRHYAWGMRRHGDVLPYIADLLGEDAGKSIPWAELWIGAHPSLSSDVVLDSGSVRLDQAIENSGTAVLGDLPEGVPQGRLPFLLKVLSCEKALSIQSHPDKATAEILHEKKPMYYPDDNHKPEVLISLTPFEAMAGFKSMDDALGELNSLASVAPWRMVWEEATELSIRMLCITLLHLPGGIVREMLVALRKELLQKGDSLSDCGRLCLLLMEQNPCDRGVMFAYLLNHLRLNPGQALFIPANVPHAYLSGTGIECMANSDNVIRAGLTPKNIDVKCLLATLNFDSTIINLISGEEPIDGERVYHTPAKEFQISFFSKGASINLSSRRPVAGVILVLEGCYEFDDGRGNAQMGGRGTSWFRPALLTTGVIKPLDKQARLVWAEVGI
ncbi:MAG: mannose-6-phosphate isomerase, class I [Victivallales bacterium]|nr:mannose-6-phosphate isomerase, class I [Victivallales bacterium]